MAESKRKSGVLMGVTGSVLVHGKHFRKLDARPPRPRLALS